MKSIFKMIKGRGSDLWGRCIKSTFILGVGSIFAKILGLCSKLILTRLLLPEEMGLMVTILSVVQFFELLTEVGTKLAIIQHPDGDRAEFLNMAWWLQMVRGTALYLLVFIMLPTLCTFYYRNKVDILSQYSISEIVTFMRITFLSIVLKSAISPRAYVLEKKFQFMKAVVLTQGSSIGGTLLTIYLSIQLRNVWALVIGFTSMSLVQCTLSYAMCPFLPRLQYHGESLRKVFTFARNMFGLPLVFYLISNIDVLVVGRVLPQAVLGWYGMSLVLAKSPLDLSNRILKPVLMSAFSERQFEIGSLQRAVLRITRWLFLSGFSALAFVAVYSKQILQLIFGEGYGNVAGPFVVLCATVLIALNDVIPQTLCPAKGKPQMLWISASVVGCVLCVSIYPATRAFGLAGTVTAMLISSSFGFLLQMLFVCRMIGLGYLRYLREWIPGFGLGVLVFMLLRLIEQVRI